MRFKGKNSYLYGDTQLIYFEEIREYLRSNEDEDLILELVEKSKSSGNEDEVGQFPPMAVDDNRRR